MLRHVNLIITGHVTINRSYWSYVGHWSLAYVTVTLPPRPLILHHWLNTPHGGIGSLLRHYVISRLYGLRHIAIGVNNNIRSLLLVTHLPVLHSHWSRRCYVTPPAA